MMIRMMTSFFLPFIGLSPVFPSFVKLSTMIGVAIIGTGQIALANHLPGFALCPDTKVVALCDSSPAALEAAGRQTGITATYTDYRELLKRDDVNAVVIATPNVCHAPIDLP